MWCMTSRESLEGLAADSFGVKLLLLLARLINRQDVVFDSFGCRQFRRYVVVVISSPHQSPRCGV